MRPKRPVRRSRPAGESLAPVAVTLALLVALAFGVGWFMGTSPEQAESPAAPAVQEGQQPPVASQPTARPKPSPVKPAAPPPAPAATEPAGSVVSPLQTPSAKAPTARIALVIDDLGRSVADVDRLEALGVPISYAVLPFEHSTSKVVARLRGREILVHLPMAPVNGRDPGPGALVEGMSGSELAAATREALAQVPGAVGVNNHMGSGITADEGAMGSILAVIGDRGLFFLDSRTTAASVGYREAIARGIPSAERQVFLDPDISPDAIRAQFQRLLEIARSRGSAVAIGHPHTTTMEVLEREVPAAVAAGYEFVPVSYLLDRPSGIE
jgi:polysaccharide deacetylase 2 family uncharacterized protein YibQ